MLRLHENALSISNGLYLYQGKPFTGIVFLQESQNIKAFNVSEGVLLEEYVNSYLLNFWESAKVNFDFLDMDEKFYSGEPLLLNGVEFTGLAFEFESNLCTAEIVLEKGHFSSSVDYYRSGELANVALLEDGFSQRYQWTKDHEIKSYKVLERSSLRFSLEFDELHALKLFSFQAGSLGRMKVLAGRIKEQRYEDLSFLEDIILSSVARLSGSGIDDTVCHTVSLNGGLGNLKELALYHTAVSIQGLKVLVKAPLLREVAITSSTLSISDLRQIKSCVPGCKIFLNHEEVK